jgi:hypothetical protein
MTKSKLLVISGPMDAVHVGGINVTSGMQPSILDSYFNNDTLEPDELPSHTFVAAGKIEVPRRSTTITSTIRRPSLSIKRSLSRLRRTSISHVSDSHSTSESRNKVDMAIDRSDSANTRNTARPLRMQSSMSRLRHKVGLDRELYESPTISKPVTPEPEAAPEPVQKDYPPLRVRKSFSRVTSHSSSRNLEPEPRSASTSIQRQPSFTQQQTSIIQRRPSPLPHQPSIPHAAPSATRQHPVRPKRADSGTAIDFNKIPVQERPLPFQEIMAVKNFAERMAMYKKTRDYWAYADHGLTEWTGRAAGPRVALGQA